MSLPPTPPPARPPGRADRPPGWRWRASRDAPSDSRGRRALRSPSPGAVAAAAAAAATPVAATAWAPLPEPEPEPEPEPPIWEPRAWRPAHQVRLELPRSARGSHGRRSNELLCKRADIPRDFVHLRARLGTPLATPYFRAGPATRDRPWAQRPPPVAPGGPAAQRRSGIHQDDRVRLKEGLTSLKNGGVQANPNLLAEITSEAAGEVKSTGPQYGGDVLVCWGDGKSLWHSPDELQAI